MTAPKRRVPCRPDTFTTSPRPSPSTNLNYRSPCPTTAGTRLLLVPQRSCSDVCRTAVIRPSTCHVGIARLRHRPPHSDKLARARPLPEQSSHHDRARRAPESDELRAPAPRSRGRSLRQAMRKRAGSQSGRSAFVRSERVRSDRRRARIQARLSHKSASAARHVSPSYTDAF